MKRLMTECPHCGSDWGIYTKCTYHEVRYCEGFAGEEQDNGEMFDNARVTGGHLVYCQNCDKVICRLSTLEKLREATQAGEVKQDGC